jgi:hypothetical protein
MAVFNDGAMIALAKDKVEASKQPNRWNLRNIFLMGIVYGLYLTLSTWALYQVCGPLPRAHTHKHTHTHTCLVLVSVSLLSPNALASQKGCRAAAARWRRRRGPS